MNSIKPPRARCAGFTMTELVVTVSLAAILSVVAVPSFSNLLANQRAKTVAAEMYATLAEARSQAISLNQSVSLKAKSGSWSNGWQVLGPNNLVLQDRNAAMGVTATGPTTVTYSPSGRIPAGTAAPMVVISTQGGGSTLYQCVSVDLGGHPYMSAASTC